MTQVEYLTQKIPNAQMNMHSWSVEKMCHGSF